MANGKLVVMSGLVVAVVAFGPVVSRAGEATVHPGVIRGIVVDAETGEVVAGAYVGVGEFGDSGGTNRSRHRKEGFFAEGQTDSEGRFELDGLVLTEGHGWLKSHPLVVTHDDYVRGDVKVELSEAKREAEVKVELTPAAKIEVTVVDQEGEPVEGHWMLRLEDLSGRRFLPPGRNRHEGSFASSVWIEYPNLRTSKNMGRSTGFAFGTLPAGEYRVEAIRLKMQANPTPASIWEQPWRYYGDAARIVVKTGEVRKVEIAPKEYGGSLTIKTPAEPFAGVSEFGVSPEDFLKGAKIIGILNISRNVGVRAWDMGLVYHVEDARLGRIQREGMFFTIVEPGASFEIENLPPGEYSVWSMAYVRVAIATGSATVEVTAGQDCEVEMPVPVIKGDGQLGTHTLNRRVEVDEREYTIKELCGIVTAATGSHPELSPEGAIEDEKVRMDGGETVLWDIVERLCAEKGLKLKEMSKTKLGIGEW